MKDNSEETIMGETAEVLSDHALKHLCYRFFWASCALFIFGITFVSALRSGGGWLDICGGLFQLMVLFVAGMRSSSHATSFTIHAIAYHKLTGRSLGSKDA